MMIDIIHTYLEFVSILFIYYTFKYNLTFYVYLNFNYKFFTYLIISTKYLFIITFNVTASIETELCRYLGGDHGLLIIFTILYIHIIFRI